MLDPVRNFATTTTTQGYDSTATSIDVQDASIFPDPSTDGAFNLVWYDETNYPKIYDDPNKEIIRVTAISGNTLTIQRAQEGTVATNKNTSGATYRLLLTPTQKTIEDIDSQLGGGTPLPLMQWIPGARSTQGKILGFAKKQNAVYTVDDYNYNLFTHKIIGGQMLFNGVYGYTNYCQSMTTVSETDNYIYYVNTTADTVRRYDISTKSDTIMTLSGTGFAANSMIASDGTYLYIFEYNTTNVKKYSINDTTITYVSTITVPYTIGHGYYYDAFIDSTNEMFYIETSADFILVHTDINGTLIDKTIIGHSSNNGGVQTPLVIFEWNGYVQIAFMNYDSEDGTHVALHIIKDNNK